MVVVKRIGFLVEGEGGSGGYGGRWRVIFVVF